MAYATGPVSDVTRVVSGPSHGRFVPVSGNLAVAFKGLTDDRISEVLVEAGHIGWRRIEIRSREENEARIKQLLAKGGMQLVPLGSPQ
jgi:hypothetical protein